MATSAAVLVTGGAGTLGRAIGRAFVAAGVGVYLVDLSGSDLEAARKDVADGGDARVETVACDLLEPGGADHAWSAAAAGAAGEVRHLVNNAGFFSPKRIHEIPDDEWGRSLNLHMTAAWQLSKRLAQGASGPARSIVNVGSTGAVQAHEDGSAAYGASKAGLVGLTIHCAVELGPMNIRSNAVLPGSFPSQINSERLSQPGALEDAAAHVPLRRLGTADEVAAVVRFLALDATYVNGAVIPCDGGVTVKMY